MHSYVLILLVNGKGRRTGLHGKWPKETEANVKCISRLYLEEDILQTFAKLFTPFHTACFIQLCKSVRAWGGRGKSASVARNGNLAFM